MLHHPSSYALGEAEGAGEVEVDDSLPAFLAHVEDRRVEHGPAGVVHQYVYAAQLVEGPPAHVVHLGGDGNVAGQDKRPAPHSSHPGGHVLQAGRGACHHGDVGARFG